jgi:hypothetical protein
MENKQPGNTPTFVFDRINYILMIAGIALIFLGFIIMSMDGEEYGFGFMGLTLGPMVSLSGFVLEVFAIHYKPKK